ncbi:hypothetical protein MUK42_20314 [Musa troglodytarum]|uniref:Uncharacterized protein n=1 Tax=Musa troglodytarum TaxID=320322 RepID=A0A9E7K237_9LILI|nr:hypothetical protein MUK42_20314 [Musa troglodytarum]
MDVLRATNPTTKTLGSSTQVDPKEEAVGTSREAEINFPIHLKPPNLLKYLLSSIPVISNAFEEMDKQIPPLLFSNQNS